MAAITEQDTLFRARIQRVRQIRGLSQSDLATGTAVLDRAAYGKIETGARRVSLGEACRIAEVLGVPLADLIAPEPLKVSVEAVVQ